jgi:hypothetical protein
LPPRARGELEAFSRRSDLLLVQVQTPAGEVFAQWQAVDNTPLPRVMPPAAASQQVGAASATLRGLEAGHRYS